VRVRVRVVSGVWCMHVYTYACMYRVRGLTSDTAPSQAGVLCC